MSLQSVSSNIVVQLNAYASDYATQEAVLCEYLRVRAFVPDLTLDAFLARLPTLIRPREILDKYCSPDFGWSAAERVALLCLYLELSALAARGGSTAWDLDAFLGALVPAYKTEESDATTSSTEGQESIRSIYTAPSGRQYRGGAVVTGENVADFQSDEGEIFRGVAFDNLSPCNDPWPVLPEVLASHTENLPRTVLALLETPPESVSGEPRLWDRKIPLGDGVVTLEIGRSSDGLRVLGRMDLADGSVLFVPPRMGIEGDYWFVTARGAYRLTVRVLPEDTSHA